MAGGRPPKGAKLVDGLEGSVGAKKRLRLILETLSTERSVGSACEELGIGQAAFFKLRTRTLQEAVEGLEPRPLGRPVIKNAESEEELEGLRSEVAVLRRELEAARVREELAIVLPRLGAETTEKKTAKRKRRARRR